MLENFMSSWEDGQHWLLAHVMLPFLQASGLESYVAYPAELVEFVSISVIQVAVIALLFRPLESWVPQERWDNRKLTRVDIFYTLLSSFGLIPLFAYVVLAPLGHWLGNALQFDSGVSAAGAGEESLFAQWVPWFNDHPLVLFLVYFVVQDFVLYWVHRLQHKWRWWWALHSLHHSQRQLSCWSNDRGHVLDSGVEAVITSLVSLIIGVPPVQFALLVLIGILIENFSHSNVRIRFGKLFDKIFVDPRFHRTHHILASSEEVHLHDCNYALVFPVWDIVFGTARYDLVAEHTGVLDPQIDADNDKFWLGQQIAGFKRFFAALGLTGRRTLS